MNLLSEVFVLTYSILMIIFIVVWIVNKYDSKVDNNKSNQHFSVIIPVRNEAKYIARLLDSLMVQSLESYEVIIVDDDSDDDTLAIAQSYMSRMDLTIISLSKSERGSAPKKNAISKALSIAKSELIFCTDGDCVLSRDLLKAYAALFENERVKFISGPVTFIEEDKSIWNRVWDKIQIVEFASLVGSAAVSIFMKMPNMCSGANIAYRKSAFLEVNAYEGNTALASGDDEFLMHKINIKYPSGIVFAKSKAAIVQTQACENLFAFYSQRKRWASKWTYYESIIPKILAVYVFLLNVFSIYLALHGDWKVLVIKLILEFVFLGLVLSFLKKNRAIIFIPLVQLVYPFYVVFFGLNSVFMNKTYDWKGRKLR